MLIKPLTSNALMYDNPPKFVFANIHGDLQVKLAKETNEGTMFYSFTRSYMKSSTKQTSILHFFSATKISGVLTILKAHFHILVEK